LLEILVSLPNATYPVQIGAGTLDHLPENLSKYSPASTYAVITDTTVSPYYAERVRKAVSTLAPCHVFVFEAGEVNKTRTTWSDLTDRMLAAGIERDGAVIALGGGVVGDLAGFVAATYHRGIDLIHLPTSLLAMVDSSIGGKTGVDTESGKNLVGAFHQPRLVVADVAMLETLPDRQLAAGLAEAVKHGAIADAAYLEWIDRCRGQILAKRADELAHLVRRSVEIKADIVMADEKEAGRRATLNFGHTVGHGLEAATSFGILHGEAVAVGMVSEARLGEVMGITEPGSAETLLDLLGALGLPHQIPSSCQVADLLESARSDKKNRAGQLRFAPIRRPGESARTATGKWTFEVQPETLLNVLRSQTA
jgi:3-dehydroquinate synthase